MRRALFAAILALSASEIAAQSPSTPDKLTVFLDCQNVYCDRNYLITELPYILLTQDRLDAEVHALITGLQTGAGGQQLTIALVGQRRFAGRVDTVVTSVPPNSPEDAHRQELARVLRLGLTPFLLRTSAGERMSLSYRALPGDSAAGGTRGLNDPWNFWVYRLSGVGDVGAESRSNNYFVELNASANRITEDWKIIFDAEWEYNANSFELDSSTVSFALRSAEFEAVALKSVTAHWSTGAGLNVGLDEFRNQDFNASVDLAAEWNYYPWREATRRQLVFIAGVSNRYFDYTEETLYDRTSEWRTALVTKVAAETRQPWGSLFAGIEHIRYLHASDIYSATLYLNMDVRVSRGFNIYFGGNASKVNDQLYLPRGDAEDDEVLTEQRELATAYRVNFYAGLSFTFGSIFNNVVNPRFNQYP
jgi:hypothetical protein